MYICSTSLKTDKWKLRFAPPPRDIYWQNLSGTRSLPTNRIIKYGTGTCCSGFLIACPS